MSSPALSNTRVTLNTNFGAIVLELADAEAPNTVQNFLEYVDSGYYDGMVFHRVIDGFMIQGGGYDRNYAERKARPAIRNEANNGLANNRYTIAMARTSAPHSATAQFFINVADNTFLNHRDTSAAGWGYAVFGKVVEGFDVVDRIARVDTGAGGPFPTDVPREMVVIESAERVTE